MAGEIKVCVANLWWMNKSRDAGLAVVLFAFGFAGGVAVAAEKRVKPDTAGSTVQSIEVVARPIAGFERLDASRTRFGPLEWIGGLVLTSNDPRFGGWSGLVLDADGSRLVAVSDAGTWMTADVVYRNGRPYGLAQARLGPLKARDGGPLKRDRDRDAEAVLLRRGTVGRGQLLVAFEQNHRLGVFEIGKDGVAPPSRYLALPRDAQRMNSLKGLEAIAQVQAGRLKGATIAIAEHLLDADGHHSGWIISDGGASRFAITDIGGFSPTDAVGLANGDVVLLERRFRWTEGVKMRIRRIRSDEIVANGVVKGEVLIEANMSQEIDNMEAISAHYAQDGSTILTIMSDDNFNSFLQRTLLLQFRLHDDNVARRVRR